MRPETLNMWLAMALLLLSILLFFGDRVMRWWRMVMRSGSRNGRSSVSSGAVVAGNDTRDDLIAHGIDGVEAELLLTLLAASGASDMRRLLNSRIFFEDALEKALTTDPDLILDLGLRRALDRIRIRRGWEVQGELSQPLSIPVEEEELLIQGPDGLSLRTIMIHRDAHSLAVRVIESSQPMDECAGWQVGDDLQVSFYRRESGCFLFETRLQEQRDLGERFLFLETPQKVSLEQRRQYARVPIQGTIRFLHLPLGTGRCQGFDRELLQEATLIDIGTGGMGFSTEAVVDPDDLLIIRGIPSLGSRDVTARVVAEVPAGQDPEAGIGVRFVGLSAIDRDRIASLVFTRRVESADLGAGFDSTEHALPSDGTSP